MPVKKLRFISDIFRVRNMKLWYQHVSIKAGTIRTFKVHTGYSENIIIKLQCLGLVCKVGIKSFVFRGGMLNNGSAKEINTKCTMLY